MRHSGIKVCWILVVPQLQQVRWLASSSWGGCGGPRVLPHPRISPRVVSGQRFSARCQVSTMSWVVRSWQNSIFKGCLSLGAAISHFQCFRLSVPSAAIASRSWLRFRDTQCSKAHIVVCISLSLQCFSFQVIDRCFQEYLRPSVVQVICCAYSGEFVGSG